MTKFCPIRNNGNNYCMTDSCAWWDEEKSQCCFKTMALAAPVKSNGDGGTFGPLNQYIQATPAIIP